MSPGDPLRPWIYPVRRPGRALPTAFVIASVTLLLVVVITPGNTFRSTLDANLHALGTFTVVSPARRAAMDPDLRSILDRNPYSRRWVLVNALWLRYPAMIGEGSCPLLLARAEETRALLDRLGLRLVAGRHASGTEPCLVLHEEVARARGVTIGSRIGTLVDPDDIVPGSFEIVGLVQGPSRIAVGVPGTGVLASMLYGRLPVFALVDARDGFKSSSDRYLHEARDGDGPAFQVIDEAYARTRAERGLRNLPLLVRFISLSAGGIVAIIVTLAMLLNFQSRLKQIAVLLAIGQSPLRLLRSLTLELAVVAGFSWLLGAVLGVVALEIYDRVALQPRGILMRVWDPDALLASATVPVLAVLVAGVTLWLALHHLDPVGVLQGRKE